MPGGRPSKYHQPTHCRIAQSLASRGYTDEEMADIMGISLSTFSLWKNKYPEFSESLKIGKDEPDDKVERALLQSALGGYYDAHKPMIVSDGQMDGSHVEIVEYQEFIPASVTAQIFWLKNRRSSRWRDRHELTGEDGSPMAFTVNFVKPNDDTED